MPPPQPTADTIYPVDLQVHSTYSDGTETPTELVAHAARLGIQVMALTDHDSVLGVDEAVVAGRRLGVLVLPALEFSTTSERERDLLDVNILAYGVDPHAPMLLETLQRVMESRVEQKIRQIERLQAYGFDVPVAEVLALAGGAPGRPHIAQVLMQRHPGRFDSISQVFAHYLAADSVHSTYVPRAFSLRAEETIEITHRAGGKAFLAHPGVYHRIQDVDGMVRRLAAAGLDGLEIHYPYSQNGRPQERPATAAAVQIAHYEALADELGLYKSGGSDYHGARKPAIHLGMAGLTLAQWQELAAACGWPAAQPAARS